ncbi:MAG TPA: hypothetical protein VN131_04130 [Mobilitalea sp.]|nr:hypothetical protein [Mobilitalea sp.]
MNNDNRQRRPGRPPGMGGMPTPPMPPMPPGMGPGMRGPSTPPPNFTPEMPRTGAPGGPAGFAEPLRGGFGPGRPMNFRGCMNRFTYIWLINGNNFWFFPVGIDRNRLLGFRWKSNRWTFETINLNRILFFRCF